MDRRRSERFAVDIPMTLEGAKSVNLVELSLGGATFETSARIPLHVPRRLKLGYRGMTADVTLVGYHSWVYELFYHPTRGSQVSYRVRATFREPSVEALNLIYRILLERWNEERSRTPEEEWRPFPKFERSCGA